MVFFWFIIPFFILMVLVGTMHQRKEEDSGHTLSDPLYESEEGLEGNEVEGRSKTSLTPL
jgi:hypothetical protein